MVQSELQPNVARVAYEPSRDFIQDKVEVSLRTQAPRWRDHLIFPCGSTTWSMESGNRLRTTLRIQSSLSCHHAQACPRSAWTPCLSSPSITLLESRFCNHICRAGTYYTWQRTPLPKQLPRCGKAEGREQPARFAPPILCTTPAQRISSIPG